ncbi:MAG TPA: Cys-tRNA(Pro) deacylase [Pseudonocardiaceae bacterium]|jgi:Cys-tRNA(Pro)/Cys-tRNA(Cys) deacylase|nr:Cys-tRNA(Pro) deacylase [Pseudonocardiaceae bacterium]
MAGRGTPATALLASKRVPHTVHSYDHDPRHASYGSEATEALGLLPDRVFKTLVAEVDGRLTVGVVPVASHLDLKALAAAVGGKRARMADVADAERATGYVAGGISPLGQRKRLPVVLDTSATQFDTVFCSGGRRGLEIELAPSDLASLANAVLAPIAAAG